MTCHMLTSNQLGKQMKRYVISKTNVKTCSVHIRNAIKASGYHLKASIPIVATPAAFCNSASCSDMAREFKNSRLLVRRVESSRVELRFFNSKLELKSSRVSSLESSSSRVRVGPRLDSYST